MRNALFILAILALTGITSAEFQDGDKIGITMGWRDQEALIGTIISIDDSFLCMTVTEAYEDKIHQNWTYPVDVCIKKSKINMIVEGNKGEKKA